MGSAIVCAPQPDQRREQRNQTSPQKQVTEKWKAKVMSVETDITDIDESIGRVEGLLEKAKEDESASKEIESNISQLKKLKTDLLKNASESMTQELVKTFNNTVAA
jgi:D-serine dehydratase